MLYTYFNLVNFYSENNIIFDNEKHYKAIKEDYESTDINLQNEDGTIFTAYVCPSFTVENYKRSYIKIQEIGANVDGLYRCIFIVIFILISLYQKVEERLLALAHLLYRHSVHQSVRTAIDDSHLLAYRHR